MTQPIDADPFIPSGVDATAEQVADMLATEKIPVETVALLPDVQKPDDDQLIAAAEKADGDTDTILSRLGITRDVQP